MILDENIFIIVKKKKKIHAVVEIHLYINGGTNIVSRLVYGQKSFHSHLWRSSHIFPTHSEPLLQNIVIKYGNDSKRVNISSVGKKKERQSKAMRNIHLKVVSRNLQ